MKTNSFDPKKALTLTRMIYFSLIAGVATFLIVVISIIPGEPLFAADISQSLILALAAFAVIALPAGFIAMRKYHRLADKQTDLAGKYTVYQSGLLIGLASCEGTALFSIVCFLITGNLFNLVFMAAALTVYLLYFPTPARIGEAINLTETEVESFYN